MVESSTDGAFAEVTFRLPYVDGAEGACVIGEFNDWSTSAHPMQRDVTGFVCRIRLPVGRTHRFRYLVDGHRWENDWNADAYVPNEFGGDDSVIDLTAPACAPDRPATPTRQQLYDEARVQGITGASRMTKAQLEHALGR